MIAFLACIGALLAHRSASTPPPPDRNIQQYDPVLRVGSPVGWKNLLLVFWNSDPATAAFAGRILRGLSKEIADKKLTANLYQVTSGKATIYQYDMLLLCVTKANYGQMIFNYYDKADSALRQRAPVRDRKILIEAAGRGFGLPRDTDSCLRGRAGFERELVLRTHRNAIARHWPIDVLPVFILNGDIIRVRSVNDIREKLLTR